MLCSKAMLHDLHHGVFITTAYQWEAKFVLVKSSATVVANLIITTKAKNNSKLLKECPPNVPVSNWGVWWALFLFIIDCIQKFFCRVHYKFYLSQIAF
ncbi:Na+/proline symporter [Filibacter limicola]|uniref:Na+/proline symporter n=1 Tax=Sporosarcina limicola TaxID=34101 RepID=A0A927MJH3_9BACL|nr:Na+/proline symporter [Sporosarcina limicola]